MKNNKGFSLVELIIVIAIMAILVGVMAPQLIKYIEKTNVSADVQLCDSVREAVQTAMMDPSVITVSANGIPSTNTEQTATFSGTTVYDETVKDILGTATPKDKLKSSAQKNNGQVKYILGTNSVVVWVTNSDMSGKKGTYSDINTTGGNSCIWAGDETLR